jgi:hypothetical protein
MKKVVYFLAVLFTSCAAIAPMQVSEAWQAPKSGKVKNTIHIDSISVSKAGSALSIEQELKNIAPLYFWEHLLLTVPSEQASDYTVNIYAREREYQLGFQTKRSVSMEVILQKDGQVLAVGQVISEGKGNLLSSERINHILKLAINKTVKALGKR